LGTTNFENKVKYTRALEGELARSLESLNGILSAKVNLGQPKDTIFTQRKTAPTASAVLRLRDGATLSRKQIVGIKNFIASAIPKLTPQNIKLINQNGTLLEYTKEDIDSTKFISQDKYKKKLEQDYEQKIVDILEPFIGTNRVVAKVSIILDFTKQDIQQEIYDPEGTIRSQQTTETSTTAEDKKANKGGTPGVQSNIQNPNEDSGALKSKSSKDETKNIVNYEISKKIVKQKDNAYAIIKRITTAVTFDSTVLEKEKNKAEFLQNIKDIVQDTVGYNKKRGDQVTVKSFKFIGFGALDSNSSSNKNLDTVNDTMLKALSTKSLLQDFGEYIQYLIAAVLLFVFYKKFIVSNDIHIETGENVTAEKDGGKLESIDDDFQFKDTSLGKNIAKNRLKAKVKTQILNNIDGLDEENIAKYEVLIEELDKEISDNPEDIASMIEMLLTEGNSKLKG